MNWLAHLALSPPHPEIRVGNLLPDLAARSEWVGLSENYQLGIRLHLRIDAFTDAHPLFRQSLRRFQPPLRRYAGILTDVFYDHVLAREWAQFHPQPLPEFIQEVYASFASQKGVIPSPAWEALARMQADDWLGSYAETEGLRQIFRRMSRRLRRPVDFEPSLTVLAEHYEAYRQDFLVFYPELQRHCGLKENEH